MTRLTWYEPDDGFDRWGQVHALLLDSFAFMDGVIDPPSSLHRMQVDDLRQSAGRWLLLGQENLQGCAALSPHVDVLYLGKIAIASELRGRGYLADLVASAENIARSAGIARLQLQTRVELAQNQRAFARVGFTEIGRTAHPGFDRPTSVTMERALR